MDNNWLQYAPASNKLKQTYVSGFMDISGNVIIRGTGGLKIAGGNVIGITKTMVGLSAVDNTSDTNKPISTAQQTALDLKAPLASPTFTGIVTIPATSVTNTTTSTSTTTGALLVAGGVGIGGSVNIGGNARIIGGLTVDGSLNVTGSIIRTDIQSKVYISEQVDVSNSGTGPGLIVRQFGTQDIAAFYDDANQVVTIKDGGDVSMNHKLNVGGIVSIHNATVSTSTTTGALQVSGGIGIGGNLYVGGTTVGITQTMVGLSNVDNTSDVNKPVSTAQQTALDLKANLASPTFTGTVSGITNTMVGLGNLDNTSDANKPVSTSQQTALDFKAPLASPTFTGTVTAPATSITNTTDSSSTATGALQVAGGAGIGGNLYVGGTTVGITKTMVGLGSVDNTADTAKPVSTAQQTALDLKATIASPTFTGTVSGITQTMVGLGNVDNTSDANKPVSTAQQTALDLKATIASPTFTGTVTLPTTLITNTTVSTSTASGALQVAGGVGIGGNLYIGGTTVGITKSMVGLGNVDDTSDASKPVSTSQQTALDLKATIASPTFTGTVSGITKTMVGLGNVDDTSDASKPVSTSQQTALDLKAPLASPTFTGTVAGITQTMVGLSNVDNTADTAKPVSTAQQTALDLKANLASPTFTGTVTAPTSSITNTTNSTSTGTGALQVTGGVGIGGNVFIGGNTRIYGGLTVDGSFNVTGSIISTTVKETVRISERVDISNSGTGPGLTVRQFGTAAIAEFFDDTTSIMQIKDGGDVSMNQQLFVGGITSIKNMTNSTSTATGALQVVGGAGIGGNLYVGGTAVGITKSMVGLGSADNTADTAKPVSTAQQTALDLKANLASPTFTGTVGGITKSMVGLGSVDNTADTAKPVSTAQQTALDLKANLASPTFTGTVGGITKSMVGLGSADNTADTAKPVSTAQQTAFNLKSNSASPTFTGGVTVGGNVILDANSNIYRGTMPLGATTQIVDFTAGSNSVFYVIEIVALDSLIGGPVLKTLPVDFYIVGSSIGYTDAYNDVTLHGTARIGVYGWNGVGTYYNFSQSFLVGSTNITTRYMGIYSFMNTVGGYNIYIYARGGYKYSVTTKNCTVGKYATSLPTTMGDIANAGGGSGIIPSGVNADGTIGSGITSSTTNINGQASVRLLKNLNSISLLNSTMVSSDLVLDSTTISGNVSSGALVVSGGAGIAGAAYVGGTIFATSTTASISTGTGALQVTGGAGIGGNVYIGATTASTSTGTGALVVRGGAGIAGSVYIGGAVTTGNELFIGTNTNDATSKTIYFGGTTGDNGYGNCVIENRIYAAGTERRELLLFSGNDIADGGYGPDRIRLKGANIAFDTFAIGTDDRNTETPRMIINQVGNVGIGITNPDSTLHVVGTIKLAGVTSITNSTVSTNTSTGALVITGGAGIVGNVYVGGNIIMANSNNNSTRFGYQALNANTGSGNTAFGYGTLVLNEGSEENTAIGLNALANSKGRFNNAFGSQSLTSALVSTSYSNGAFGCSSLRNLTSGSQNTSIGESAMIYVVSGSDNTAIGNQSLGGTSTSSYPAGSQNTAIGNQAGKYLGVGSNNTFIGSLADSTFTTSSNSTAVGYNSKITASNQIVLGTATEYVSIVGTANSTSTATGALIVTGGAGIRGNVFIGGNAVVGGNLFVSGTTSFTAGTISGAAIKASTIPSGKFVTGAIATADIADSAITAAKITLGTITGNLLSSTATTAGTFTINNSTASTTTSTGALVISGGAGIGGNLYVGGNVVSGGAGIYVDLNITGTCKIKGVAPVVVTVTIMVGMYDSSSYGWVTSSLDGINWTNSPSTFAGPVVGLLKSNGTYFIVVNRDEQLIWKSYDGTNWTSAASNNNGFYAVTSNINLFVFEWDPIHEYWLGIRIGIGTIMKSTDGINWLTIGILGNYVNMSMTYDTRLQKWFIVTPDDHFYFTSPDGITWTSYESDSFWDSDHTDIIAPGYNQVSKLVHSSSIIIGINGSGYSEIYSFDGITWYGAFYVKNLTWDSTGGWIGSAANVSGYGENIYTSSDGINWTSVFSPDFDAESAFNGSISFFKRVDNYWLVTTDGGVIYKSINSGANWTLISLADSSVLVAIETKILTVTSAPTGASTSTSTGALVVSGGVGITGNAFIGGNTVVGGNLFVSGTTSFAAGTISGAAITASTIPSGKFVTGAIVTADIANSSITAAKITLGTITGNLLASTLTTSGTIASTNSTASTSTTTGALVVSGGAGIGGNVYVGGNIIMTNVNNNSTRFGYLALNANTGSSNTGFGASALTTNSGNNNTAIGSSALTANTGSSNTGVGYFAGGSISTGINNTVIGSSAGGANLTISGNITLLGANTNLSATTWTGSTAIGHDAQITASNQIVMGTASEYVSITGTTASTSISTGALIVSGGAGIGGNVYVGGAIKISSTTVSATPELLVAVGYDSTNTNTIFTATDGTNWTGRGYYDQLTGLKWNGAYWLVISINTNKILKSYDGVTWTPNTTVPWSQVYYIEWNSNNSFWVAYGLASTQVYICKSIDGVTWTIETALVAASITGMAYSPSIPLMVIGYGTVFYYSTNGTSSWSAGGGNMGGSTTGIKWFNDKFISYSNWQPQYSTNGSTWTNITWSGTAYTFNDVHWNGSLWMATLAGSGIATSSNGITWTRVYSTITTFTAITWWPTNTYWIAGTSATSHYRSFDNGVSWNGPHAGNMTQVKAIATSPAMSTTLPTQSTNTSTGALVVTGGAGIGGNLNVGGTALFTDTTASSTTQSGALQVRGGAGFGKAIYAPAFTVSSDSRIKKNITDMSGQSSLESLRNLKPSEYSLINNPEQSKVYGLIAQEVKQNIPEAVSIGTDFVPSIYEMAFIDDYKTTVTLINKTTDVSWNRIKISDEHYDVADIIDDKTFRIKTEIPKDKIELVDVSGAKLTLNQGVYRYKDTNEIYTGIVKNGVFVYGPEVPDFHSLNKDVIWTVTTRATQELDRQLQEARQTIRNQDDHILKLEQEITLIKEHLHM